MTHVLRVLLVIGVVTFGTLLPFLPGRYDRMALPLSGMFRLIGGAGMLLVPVGAIWIACRRWPRLAAKQYGFAIAVLIVLGLIGLLAALGALVQDSASLAAIALLFWAFVIARLHRRLAPLKHGAPAPLAGVTMYLIVLPTAVLLLQRALVPPAVTFSRNRAIANSARLIADIERYRDANGHYPASTLSVWPDYLPSIVGIAEYRYEPSGDAYNVLFDQPAADLATREIVVYNPRDRQVATSHAQDVLQLTPAALAIERTRGHFAVHDAPFPHWKYFWFD